MSQWLNSSEHRWVNLSERHSALEGNQIKYGHEVGVPAELGKFDGPFSPRFSPDGKRVLVLNGFGLNGKGRLDDVLSIDMTLRQPRVTEKIPQLADGLESLAITPDSKMAVVTCLGKGPWSAPTGFGRLAVIDLTRKPAQLLYQTPVEIFPEGIEFAPDGKCLFVGCTFADHIAVFKVDGFRLHRTPYILPCGHGPVSLGLSKLVPKP